MFTPLAACRWQGAEWVGMRGNRARILRGPTGEYFATLALVAFFTHALIPTGFMPGVVHGQPQLVICNGGISGLAHHGHHGSSGSHSDAVCPFAMSGGAAPLPAILGLPLLHETPDLLVPLVELAVLSEAPPRYTAPRGPPTLA